MIDIRPFIASSRLGRCLILLFFAVAYLGCVQGAAAQVTANPETKASASAGTTTGANAAAGLNTMPRMRGTTNAQRKLSAAKAALRRSAEAAHVSGLGVHANTIAGIPGAPGTALTPAQLYFSGIYPNYANSPLPNVADTVNCSAPNYCGIRKFVDGLPGLTAAGANDLGQFIPIAVPDTTTFPGTDYYEISLVDWTEKMHKDLPVTRIRGYVQTNGGTATPHYLGPLIIAQSGRAVRVKFINNLPAVASGGNLFIPTDKTVMGSGLGLALGAAPYLDNRATVHLHGGATPWISDGTPHQWTIPAVDWNNTPYQRGASVSFVPDMFFHANGTVIPQCSATVVANCSGGTAAQLPADATNDPGHGALTFYYTNQQSARLMFYHDHAYGTTRLNVYVGEAAGYLLQDTYEADLVNGTNVTGINPGLAKVIPAAQIPLVIQDKTFVPQNFAFTNVYSVPVLSPGSGYTAPVVSFTGGCTTEPTATATVGTTTDPFGQFIFGAVTGITLLTNGSGCTAAPVVTITDPTGDGGAAAFAYINSLSQQDPTWDSNLWGAYGSFWYPHVYMPNQWPSDPGQSGANPMGRWDYAAWFWPVFTNQYLVRGPIACPSAYDPNQVCPGTPTPMNPGEAKDLAGNTALGVGSIASLTPEAFVDTPVINGTAYPTVTLQPQPYRFRILSVGNDRTIALSWWLACGNGFYTPSATAIPCPTPTVAGIAPDTEVGMVPAAPTAGFPSYWPTDGRDGGVPDPASAGPWWQVIGNEGGFLAAVASIPPAPTNYEYNRRSVTVTNTSSVGLELMPAERADVVVDFSPFAGKTLILYNDAPAPNPAFDSRYDYYTGDPDQSGFGGAPTTLAGFGPNTRTIMQVHVAAGTGTALNVAALKAAIPLAFKASQPPPIVPEPQFSALYGNGKTFKGIYPALQDQSVTFTPIGAAAPVTIPLLFKTIQELFELDYGRMNATLGTELPLTNFNTQTTIPLGYVDPFTEDVYDSKGLTSAQIGTAGDGSQIWMVIHNGVDSHAIHFHLENVQVLNRYGWDGTNRPPLPIEYGWKDTVRMNPLEIDFVALRPVSMNLPFPVPDSVRLLDVTKPAGVVDPDMSAFNPLNNAATQLNTVQAMGWEYVWHCHILGHEENDMMREEVFQVAPQAPLNVVNTGTINGNRITFTDTSLSEAGFTLQGSATANFATIATTTEIPAKAGYNTTVTSVNIPNGGQTRYFRVRSHKKDADYWNPIIGVAALPDLVSPWVYQTTVIAPPVLQVSPASLTFGNQTYLTTSAAQSVTLTNIGLVAANLTSIGFTGTNPTSFAVSGQSCGVTLASGASCTINATFTPQAGGPLAANLSIVSNDPANPTLNVAVTGFGQYIASVTPTAASKLWGAADPALTGTLTGFQPADGVTATYSRVAGETPGTYTISATLAPAGVLGKYVITYNTGTFTVYAAAQLTAPIPNGATLLGTSQTFTWNNGGGATGELYQLQVGTTGVGSSNLYSGAYVTALSATVPNIPLGGGTVYVRLRTYSFGAWVTRDYTFIEAGAPVPAAMTFPATNGATVTSPVAFTWNTGTGVTLYQLLVGSVVAGTSDIYNGAYVTTTAQSVTIPSRLAGGTIYVTLRSYINGAWQSNAYTYRVAGTAAPATLTNPPVVGTHIAGTLTFAWSAGSGVNQYQLLVGTGASGSSNIYNGAYVTTTSTSITIPAGTTGTIYVRLRSYINGAWQNVNYTYVTP